MPYFPPPQTGATFANPTASVGLTAVNGSATTAMRSDGAPALDQTAAYAFTGLGKTTISQQATNVVPLTMSNVTNTTDTRAIDITQTVNATGTRDMGIFYNLIPGASTPGSASTVVRLQYNSVDVFSMDRSGNLTITSSLLTAGNVTANAAGQFRWNGRTAILSGTAASIKVVDDTTNLTGFILTGTGLVASAPVLQLGAASAASPVAQTLQAQGSRAGTDSNVGGAGLTVTSGLGTGTGTRSVLTLQSPVVAASGTGAQTQTTGWRIDGGTAVSTGYTVATLPATPLTGARAHVTDALAPTFLATIVGGGAITTPVFYNGSAWVGG